MAENLGDGFYMSKQNVDVYRFVSGMLYIQNVFNKLCCHLVRPVAILSCDAQAKAASSVGGLPVAPVEPSPASDREAEILRLSD